MIAAAAAAAVVVAVVVVAIAIAVGVRHPGHPQLGGFKVPVAAFCGTASLSAFAPSQDATRANKVTICESRLILLRCAGTFAACPVVLCGFL